MSHRIIYVDSPTFEERMDYAKRIQDALGLPVDAVVSIEEFAAHLRQRKYAVIASSDSMLFQSKVVQGWSTLVKFLAKTRKDDLSRFVVLTNRAAVVEEATLSQVQAFLKTREFPEFVDYAKVLIETVQSG